MSRCEIRRHVFVPVTHPLSGQRVNVRQLVHDRLVSTHQAAELRVWVTGEACSGTVVGRDTD